ncbi:MAG: DUF2948 family protein [Alphaproteobacteria bacterium]|nr:DUF2948 family protein [Alphaproteobacteria bacterium]
MSRPLKLYGRSADDMAVISAHLQDAVAQLGDMAYLADEQRFVLLVNRFCWEEKAAPMRVRSALQLANVTSIRQKKLNLTRREGVVALLAVHFLPDKSPAGEMRLQFAGGGEIGLAVEACEAILEDITAPWAAKARPHHDLDK